MRNLVFVLFLFSSLPLWAEDVPDCAGLDGANLPINNGEILRWKFSTANRFKAAAHAKGLLTRIFPDRTKHRHFEIQLGDGTHDTIEIVYSSKFGALPPELQVGSVVEACGEYLTANAPFSTLDASPSGAIIHWVHKSNDLNKHASGFVAIDEVAYGI